MAVYLKTSILCLDDHRNFSDAVRKRFSDTSRYEVMVFYNSDDLLRSVIPGKPGSVCRVMIIGLNDSEGSRASVENIVEEIKKRDPAAGILVIVNPDNSSGAHKELRFNIDGFIPRNSNMVLRVHNAVKRHISEHNLSKYRKRKRLSLTFLAAGVVAALIILLLARMRFPLYF